MGYEIPGIDEVRAILDRLGHVHIGVVGDFCLDFYQFLDMSTSETSLETGLPTMPVREVRYSLGGAGNVVSNLCAMGITGVHAYGVVGSDAHAAVVRSLLDAAGADGRAILTQEADWLTHTYTKVMEGDHEHPRIDWGNYNVLSDRTAGKLIELIRADLQTLDLLIINQQLTHGIHTPAFRAGLVGLMRNARDARFMVDARDYADEFDGAIRKINESEALKLCAPDAAGSRVGARNIANETKKLYRRWNRPLLVTRGEKGCAVRDEDGLHEIPGIVAPGPIDTVGAGDSLLAGAAAALAASIPLPRAAAFGNLVAAVTIRKLHQTGTASRQEITSLAETAVYRYRPELAAMPERAAYISGTGIEVVTGLPSGRRFRFAVFDNDGTISTLRQGWERIMRPMMVRAIFGSSIERVDEATYRSIGEDVDAYIDRTTGVQTLVQMHGLSEMVRSYGFVAPGKIRTPQEYKELYNRELLTLVNDRIARIRNGTLSATDFLIKGATDFISFLAESGIRLFLASGTDHDDVVREAKTLGYADLFGDSIYGSVGDIENDPKKVVIGKILADIGSGRADNVIVFGDGPVEIRETGRRGGYAIGVASDEVRRFDLNPAKRKRLIEAGADIIISDFSQHRQFTEQILEA